ncbi:MAG: Stk1 family PASTA domain-containing Ser/Thr kinase [Actinomycetota bacterium]
MTTVPRDTIIGRLVDGRYEVLERVARGGMATVYRAIDRRLDRDVAVKVMHPHLAESEDFISRFRREARAAARLSHPHVVAVHDQGLWEDSFYLTMEYIDGHDLRSELRVEGALTLERALTVTQSVLDALAAAHRRDLIHRDIKPENVMVTHDGVVKVADFGLARAVSEATAASTGTVLGTVAYLAPELLTTGQATQASDVYAVGIMLYEMVTGHQPFTGDVPINVAFQHVNSSVPVPSEELEWVPTEVDDLVAALTARDPVERLTDGAAALAATRRVIAILSGDVLHRRAEPVVEDDEEDDGVGTASLDLGSSQGTVALPVGGVEDAPAHAKEPRRRRRVLPWLVVLILLAGGSTAGWWFLAGPGSTVPTPAVVGMTEGDAVATLEANGLGAVVERGNDDEVPAGEVISTSPGQGELIVRAGDVTVLVSLGILMLDVPAVEGLLQDEALEAIVAEGFAEPVVDEGYHQSVPAGTVISASEATGTSLPHTTVIELLVSLGREPVTAPEVASIAEDEATAALEEAGLIVERAEEYSNDVPLGAVISQAPGPGQLYRGDTVTITVSLGRPFATVPSVFGMSRARATSALEEAGFAVKVESLWGGSLGVVRFQDPAGGQQARQGSTVTITVV